MANVVQVGDSVASQLMTLEAFLEFDDGTDALYELEDGELRLMPTESEINVLMGVRFCLGFFFRLGFPLLA